MGLRRVIAVTDGDCRALDAVEVAAQKVGARCISLSGCRDPKDARWTPEEVEELILSTPWDPVVVLVDDEGKRGEGWGEKVLRHLAESDRVKLLGVVAVASDLEKGNGAHVSVSVTAEGEVVPNSVDKEGRPLPSGNVIKGDTVENADALGAPIVVGLGDPGKMDFADDARRGAPITTKALELVLEHHGALR